MHTYSHSSGPICELILRVQLTNFACENTNESYCTLFQQNLPLILQHTKLKCFGLIKINIRITLSTLAHTLIKLKIIQYLQLRIS